MSPSTFISILDGGLATQSRIKQGEELFEANGAALVPVYCADRDADHGDGVVVADGDLGCNSIDKKNFWCKSRTSSGTTRLAMS